MLLLFRLMRNTVFVAMLLVSLASTAVGMGVWAVSLAGQVTAMTASAAATAIANRKAIATAVARTKAKARLRRVMVALPVAGLAAAAVFERQDYLEWKEDNPDGDLEAYACELAAISGEVVDEVLQELPAAVRPPPETLLARLPACADPQALADAAARLDG
ncbi:hypothetical protein [Hoeflea olei]|uniref:Uncharacterized protein n=1 Tax=Hoeflea olei TaxID=1480615 RepID=A0A1C1YTH1_9HYPH|nr:hypothetical protein [Hoeflea olei]OCW56746.1 hypothetical protein AWJ14_17635 [Hoeflea olei]